MDAQDSKPFFLHATRFPRSLHSHQAEKILWLEAFRGAAAVWVLLHHAVQATPSVSPESGQVYRVLANGDLGVVLFFVLSGFIIALASEKALALGQGFDGYLRARLTRIYLPYLPVGLGVLALYLLWPGLAQDAASPPGLLTSSTLLPSQSPPALSVAWTLVHELFFYVVYALIFVSRRLLHVVMLAWVAAMLWVWLGQVELSRTATYLLSPINLCFVLGVLTFHATYSGLSKRAGLVLLVLGLGLVASQAGAVDPIRTVAALGFSCWVAAAVSPLLTRLRPGPWLVALGAASYSIYLVHKPVLGAMARATALLPVAVAPSLLYVLLAAAALLSGLLYFHAFERPAMRWMRKRAQQPAVRRKLQGP